MEKQILLVDDEKDFTDLICTLLGFHGFRVDALNDSIDVEKVLSQKKYDLVVTDLMMPHVSGFDLISLLRKKKEYADVPLIALSAKTLNDEERKILLQNKVHFMVKPFEPQGLVEKIRQILH